MEAYLIPFIHHANERSCKRLGSANSNKCLGLPINSNAIVALAVARCRLPQLWYACSTRKVSSYSLPFQYSTARM